MKKPIFFFFIILFYQISFSQKEPKVKEISYHFEFNSMDFIGEYDGEVLRVEIDGKKRKSPLGYGVFKGKYKGLDNVDLWIVYNGNWLDGKLDGKGTFITLSTKKEINPVWSEIDSVFTNFSGEFPNSINEYYSGMFSSNSFVGDSSTIKTSNYSFYGDVVNWLPHGNGNLIKNDTLEINSIPTITNSYEGVFTNGKFDNGTIRIAENGVLKGIVNDGKFSGEGNITFPKSLAISLAKNACEAVSYNGKITASKFDNGQIKLKSGEILTGTLTNNMFTGKGSLSIGGKYLYEGDWLEGDIHGQGKITKKNEWAYSGSFDKNQLVGSGELMYFIGNTYVGNFQGRLEKGQIDITLANNEKLKISNINYELEGVIIDNTLIGFGELEYKNKASYKGSFSMPFDAERIDEKPYADEIKTTGITSGEGRFTYSNGDTLHVRLDKDGIIGTGRVNAGFTENGDSLYLEGTFRNGLLGGTGKACFMYKMLKDGKQEFYATYTGQFQGGAIHGNGVLYVQTGLSNVSLNGTWVNNAFTKGTMVEEYISSDFIGNDTYSGFFFNNQLIGQGVLKSDEGTYTGNFEYGDPHGNGKYVYADGRIYEGEMKFGSPNGKGKYVYADGRIYEGEMKDGSPNGKGKMTLKSKQVLTGKFTNGEYQKPFSCKEVKIGDQIWMVENLNVAKFGNGDLIPEAKTDKEWDNAGKNGQPAWCYYQNNTANGTKYGKLYNWYAVNDARGLAPTGWHIPTDNEWTVLSTFLGGGDVAGKKMKSVGWLYGIVSTNSSGFSGLPGGSRAYGFQPSSFFAGVDFTGDWWSASENGDRACGRLLTNSNSNLFENCYTNKSNGESVRCLKD